MATPIPDDFSRIDPTSPVRTRPSPGVQVIKTRRHVLRAIAEKHETLGGAPGEPKVAKVFYVGRASQKYNQLGGPNGFLGWPVSDALPDRLERFPSNCMDPTLVIFGEKRLSAYRHHTYE
jgi:hypothetical protein